MLQEQRRVAILHHSGGGNFGDDAILDSVIGNIRRRWSDVEIILFSMNPEDTAKRHEITAYPIRRHTWSIGYKSERKPEASSRRSKLLRWLETTRHPAIRLPRAVIGELLILLKSYRRLNNCDMLIVSGGGQLTERGGPWSFPYALFTWSLLAKVCGVPFHFLSVGAGPLNHWLSRFFVKRVLFASDYVSFRDRESQLLAIEIGFTRPSYVFPDNVFGLDIETYDTPKSTEHRIVGVAPMPFPFCDLLKQPPDPQAIQNELIAKITVFSSLVADQSYVLELFGSDAGADPPEIEHLRETLRSRHGIELPEYQPIRSVSELLSRMAAMDYVVTCRFHGVVFAVLLNKPVLAISHHPKVADLMSALGLSEYCVDMRSFDPVDLSERFRSLTADADSVKRRLATCLEGFKKHLAHQFDNIFPPSSRNGAVPEHYAAEHVQSMAALDSLH